MRIKSKYRLTSLIISLALIFAGSVGANVTFCKVIKGYTGLNQRLHAEGVRLGNRVNELIRRNPDVPGASRFSHPEMSPRAQAVFQLRLAFGRCEHHWPNGADEQTLEMLSEMLLDRRVIDAVDVDYETIGAGFGKIMARYVVPKNGDANDRARKFITNLRQKMGDPPFESKGYTEAHYFRDLDEIFQEFPNGDGYNIGSIEKFVNTQTTPETSNGTYLEVVVASRRKGEVIRGLSVDSDYPSLPGVKTGIDILTNQGAYNVARSYTTVASKLNPDDIVGIAKAIVKARAEGIPYKFTVGIEGDVDLTQKLIELNAAIKNVPDVPADFPDFTTADILPAF